jgi:hypothetical protein
MTKLSSRDKAILAGLYLSKFDSLGLLALGFESFIEAFNVIGSTLGVRPASVKNYRDEFDPLFPNKRKGWRNRAIRDRCRALYESFGGLNQRQFAALIKQTIYKEHDLDLLLEKIEKKQGEDVSFARRLITGQAAEEYFKSNFRGIASFKHFEIEDTTKLGCGFDFKLVSANTFYAIEVKGLREASGMISLTGKEHLVASLMKARFFLFVVKNFREQPYHEIYQDPTNGSLIFNRTEQRLIQVSWAARV